MKKPSKIKLRVHRAALGQFSKRSDGTSLRRIAPRPVTSLRKLPNPEQSKESSVPLRVRKAQSISAVVTAPRKSTLQYLIDIASLSATALNLRYRTTYDSWKNMKQRARTHGAVIAPEFEQFRNFLKLKGPRPRPEYTLDRLDPTNPMYGPGLCEWRNKEAQSNNRGITVFLTDDKGDRHPLTRWARLTGQNANTMRKRLSRGWNQQDVIAGVRRVSSEFPQGDSEIDLAKKWPGASLKNAEKLELLWRRSGPETTRMNWLIGQAARYRDRDLNFWESYASVDAEGDEDIFNAPSEVLVERKKIQKILSVVEPVISEMLFTVQKEREERQKKREEERMRPILQERERLIRG